MVSPGAVAFTLFGLDIRWYGIIIAGAILLAGAIGYKRTEKHHGIRKDDYLDILLVALPCAVVGARAYYVAFNWGQYAGNFAKIINIRLGGLAIHGGLIAAFIAVFFVCRHKGIRISNALDLGAPCIALAQSIGRWGNFFNEEAHGIRTDLPWAVVIDGVPYHPTFLYESVWCLLLFVVLLIADDHRAFPGQVICLYGMLYSVERFFVEWLRTDSLMIGPFRQAMVISVFIFALSFIMYFVMRQRERDKIWYR